MGPLPMVFMLLFLAAMTLAASTWPSPIDELEDLMYLISGYRSRTFASAVIPCSRPPAGTSGRMASAEWIRTAFHDAATGTKSEGTGGLDASLMFETSRSENIGAAFPTTMQFMCQFHNRLASASDLIALGLLTATRSCGGPVIPFRAGRIDATQAGPIGVPEPQNSAGTLVNQIGRMGFDYKQAIILTACGHSIGGVHSVDFDTIVAPAANGSDVYQLDAQPGDVFDNRMVMEYLAGNSTNAMVTGLSQITKRDSDARLFQWDRNITIATLADPKVFAAQCAATFQAMIEVVPSRVTLSDPILPYDIKPSMLQLDLLTGGQQMLFSGEVRIRTTHRTQESIANVKLSYFDRNGSKVVGLISASFVGNASSFDDTFAFYAFSQHICSNTSISKFHVSLELVDGSTELFDNNGMGYPVQNEVILQTHQSCLSNIIDGNGERNMTIVAAVRSTNSTPALTINLPTDRGVAFPLLVDVSQSMSFRKMIGPYRLFATTYIFNASYTADVKFDVGSGTFFDSFKSSERLGFVCGAFPGEI